MIFILRSDRAPTRVVRETDEGGTSRTFWVWSDGAWVVATRFSDGAVQHCGSTSVEVELERGDNVSIIRVVHLVMLAPATVPAPPPTLEELPHHAISAIVPVAPRVADLDVVGQHADPSAPPANFKRRA